MGAHRGGPTCDNLYPINKFICVEKFHEISGSGVKGDRMKVTVQGIDVFVREAGEGPSVLFLHGNPDSADIWDDVIKRLEKHFRCFAPDLPGFGRSGPGSDFDCGFSSLGKFTGELVAALGLGDKIFLVAHDFGGAFAMAWAAVEPQRVKRMAVINHPFFVGGYSWHFLARVWRTPWLGELSTWFMDWRLFFYIVLKLGSKKLSGEKIRSARAQVTPAMKKMVLKLYRAANAEDFQRWQPAMRRATALIPTLVLWGRHDPFIPSWVADTFGADTVRRFETSGHWLPAEAPEAVADELLRFFSEPDMKG